MSTAVKFTAVPFVDKVQNFMVENTLIPNLLRRPDGWQIFVGIVFPCVWAACWVSLFKLLVPVAQGLGFMPLAKLAEKDTATKEEIKKAQSAIAGTWIPAVFLFWFTGIPLTKAILLSLQKKE